MNVPDHNTYCVVCARRIATVCQQCYKALEVRGESVGDRVTWKMYEALKARHEHITSALDAFFASIEPRFEANPDTGAFIHYDIADIEPLRLLMRAAKADKEEERTKS